jgi:hypothetical protein
MATDIARSARIEIKTSPVSSVSASRPTSVNFRSLHVCELSGNPVEGLVATLWLLNKRGQRTYKGLRTWEYGNNNLPHLIRRSWLLVSKTIVAPHCLASRPQRSHGSIVPSPASFIVVSSGLSKEMFTPSV